MTLDHLVRDLVVARQDDAVHGGRGIGGDLALEQEDRVHHGVGHVGAAAHDLGVDRVLDVPLALPGQHIAVGCLEPHAVFGDFLDSPAGRPPSKRPRPSGSRPAAWPQTMSVSPAAAGAPLASTISSLTLVAIGQLASRVW
jgi:hypothetical protein